MEKWQVGLGKLSARDGWTRGTDERRFSSLFARTSPYSPRFLPFPFLFLFLSLSVQEGTTFCHRSVTRSLAPQFTDSLHRTTCDSCSLQFLFVQKCRYNRGCSYPCHLNEVLAVFLLRGIKMYRRTRRSTFTARNERIVLRKRIEISYRRVSVVTRFVVFEILWKI